MAAKLELKKHIGFWGAVALVARDIIGSGIFVSPTGIAKSMGSVGGSLIIWTLCGVVGLLISQVYAELGAYITESGGDYAYEKKALGRPFSFLFIWVMMTVLRPASTATVCLVCSEYLLALFFSGDDCGSAPRVIIVLLTLFLIFLIGLVNSISVPLARNLQIVTTIGKLSALVVIIIGGIVNLINGKTENFENSFAGTTTNVGDIAVAFYNGLWAYNGWANLNYATEEVEDAKRVMARAIWVSLPLVIIIYLLTNVSYFTVMDIDGLLSSSTVAVTWAEATIPSFVWFIILAVACSTLGSGNGGLLCCSRLTYAAARDNSWLGLLSMISVKWYTPFPSVIYVIVFAVVFAVPAEVGTLINLMGFSYWIFYFLTTLSLIILRFKRPNDERAFKLPLVIPFIVLLIAGYLVFAPLIFTDDRLPYVWATCFVVGGLILYFPFVHFALKLPGIDFVTAGLQMLLQVAPGDDELEMKGEISEAAHLENSIDADKGDENKTYL